LRGKRYGVYAYEAAHHEAEDEIEDEAEDYRRPPVSRGIGLALERFLKLPVAVVLVASWMAGMVLLGACVLLAYAGISALAGW
jgi:hypothetical protein